VEETEPEAPQSDAKKKLVLKVVVVFAVIAILVIIFLSAAPADPYDTVDKIMSDPTKYEGTEVEVRGEVETWNPAESSFNLAGYSEENPTYIVITYNAVPSQFANGKDVVVKGVFHHNGSAYQIDVVDVDDILVGCSSRY
jgi:cytochrome c-type biogenesis protein CcmE